MLVPISRIVYLSNLCFLRNHLYILLALNTSKKNNRRGLSQVPVQAKVLITSDPLVDEVNIMPVFDQNEPDL